MAQPKTVKLHGTVMDTSIKTIEITHLIDDQFSKWGHTKLNVESGKFSTFIKVPFPTDISISYRDKIFDKIYIYDDAQILVDSIGVLHVIGSSVQDEYENEFLLFFNQTIGFMTP